MARVVDGTARLERRVKREPGFGPQQSGVDVGFDLLADLRVLDGEEALCERAIVVDDLVAHLEYVHCSPLPSLLAFDPYRFEHPLAQAAGARHSGLVLYRTVLGRRDR